MSARDSLQQNLSYQQRKPRPLSLNCRREIEINSADCNAMINIEWIQYKIEIQFIHRG